MNDTDPRADSLEAEPRVTQGVCASWEAVALWLFIAFAFIIGGYAAYLLFEKVW